MVEEERKRLCPGQRCCLTLWYFFCFPSVSQPPSWMGLGCLCGIGVSPCALPEHGGNCVPTPAAGLEAAAPLLNGGWLLQLLPCARASHGMGEEDLHIPGFHLYLPTKTFSGQHCATPPCHRLSTAVTTWRVQRQLAGDAPGHHGVRLQQCSHLAKQGDAMPTPLRREHHQHTVPTSSFSSGCGSNAVSVLCCPGHASG